HSLVDAATGSAWTAVTAAANGIVTRGVLLDIARVRDVPWLEPGQGVFPDDLEEAERRQGVRVRCGPPAHRPGSCAARGWCNAGLRASRLARVLPAVASRAGGRADRRRYPPG